MAFTITIQSSSSEKKKVDKTLTDLAALTGTLRNDTSIIDPTFRIEGDLSQYLTANYCTVPAFGRSYFINNIRSLRAGLFELVCHVDVLSSFKTGLRTNSAIIHRSERNWNLYLNDGSLKITQRPEKITTQQFSNGDAFAGPGKFSYVLVLAG